MRLTPYEITSIREAAARHFGEGSVVRLFGSRLNDGLEGGDIDLHVTLDGHGTTEGASADARLGFLRALENRIGDIPIDVLLHDRSESRRAIDDIAILTGRVLGALPSQNAPEPEEHEKVVMTENAYRRLVADAIMAARTTIERLAETLDELGPKLPLDARGIGGLSRYERLLTDSLLLQYGNLVALLQDQILRGFLLMCDGKLENRNREVQRLRAETLGILPPDLGFPAIVEARNRVAHRYPADPAKQAAAINEVAAAVPLAITAFEALAASAAARGLPDI